MAYAPGTAITAVEVISAECILAEGLFWTVDSDDDALSDDVKAPAG